MNLRNLEQIQEQSSRSGVSFGTLLLSAVAGGALVVVAMMTFNREREPERSHSDALEQLLAEQSPASPAAVVSQDHVTFPGLLSDHGDPTTALAAVKDERGRLLQTQHEPPASEPAPSATTHAPLTQGALPIGDLLSSTTVTREPKDDLSQMAAERVSPETEAEMAPAGQQGGYEIQVASFRAPEDADAFVEELRKRGHRAYRQAAYVPERGLWHRVRIGPFKSKYKAQLYKRKFEKEERVSTFLVDPAKVKRQKEARDAKERALKKRKERLKKRRMAAAAK